MRVVQRAIKVETRKRIDILDVTEFIRELLREIAASDGIVNLFVPHTTAAITLNEAEPGLLDDIEDLLERLAPELSDYNHNRIDNNAHAHLRNVVVGSSVTIPVSGGNLLLGTWQRILFLEGDGPRTRTIVVTYIGL